MRYFLLFFFLLAGISVDGQNADLIIYNAIIYNPSDINHNHNAIAFKNNLILAVGITEDILKHSSKQTTLLDANNNFLMPGFIEGHGHFRSLGEARLNLSLGDAKNWEEILEKVKEKVAESTPGEWIKGRGWHQEKWDKSPGDNILGFPNNHKLSAISPNNPVVLRHASGHILIANKKAMEEAGITQKTISPPGGEIFKDENGVPSGIFNESAMDLITNTGKKSNNSQAELEILNFWKKCVDKAEEICLQNGITSFQDAGSSFEEIEAYRNLASNKDLSIRLWVMLNDDMEKIKPEFSKHINNFSNMFFKWGGIKVYIDGALGSRGAWLLEPYTDNPHTHGHRIISDEDFKYLASLCMQYDLQLCCHAIGDKGNRVVFDIYEQALDQKDRRWRIEHAQHLHPDDLSRFSNLGVIAAMQPNHCTSDAPFVERRLGKKRSEEGAYVWRKILNMKARLNLGTDTPVEEVDPLKNIYAACTRIIPGSGESFYPDQKLSRKEALYYYTMGNAYSVFEENIKGSLDKGKLADVIILNKDISTCSDDELLNTQVLYTIIGGNIKYRR